MSKRPFQVLDEMNVNDENNKTATCACCFDLVEAKTANGGAHVIMGVPAEALHKIMQNEYKPMLVLLDMNEYNRIGALPVEGKLQDAQQRAEETAEKIIDLMDFVSEAKGQISNEEIIYQVSKYLPVFLEALTPKPTTNDTTHG